MKVQENKYRIMKYVFLVVVIVSLGYSVFFGIRSFTGAYYFENTILNNINGRQVRVQPKFLTGVPLIGPKVPYKTVTITIPDLASAKVGEDSNNVINNAKLADGIETWLKTMYQRDKAKEFTDKLVVKYRDDTVINDDLTKD
ncbi:MAG: hypothetical protein LBS41_03950 [Streptococcaceae bacterium]|jgi:hypothetical protein|nr:hypothetical protein [Streptococcaceae bacterium]